MGLQDDEEETAEAAMNRYKGRQKAALLMDLLVS